MNKLIQGRVWKLGDDIDTDIIIPTQFLALQTIDEMKKFAFYPLRPELPDLLKPGDILVAGKISGAVLQGAGACHFDGAGRRLRHCQVICAHLLSKCFNNGLYSWNAPGYRCAQRRGYGYGKPGNQTGSPWGSAV